MKQKSSWVHFRRPRDVRCAAVESRDKGCLIQGLTHTLSTSRFVLSYTRDRTYTHAFILFSFIPCPYKHESNPNTNTNINTTTNLWVKLQAHMCVLVPVLTMNHHPIYAHIRSTSTFQIYGYFPVVFFIDQTIIINIYIYNFIRFDRERGNKISVK